MPPLSHPGQKLISRGTPVGTLYCEAVIGVLKALRFIYDPLSRLYSPRAFSYVLNVQEQQVCTPRGDALKLARSGRWSSRLNRRSTEGLIEYCSVYGGPAGVSAGDPCKMNSCLMFSAWNFGKSQMEKSNGSPLLAFGFSTVEEQFSESPFWQKTTEDVEQNWWV